MASEPNRMIRVFISSTWQDLQPEREAVERVLHRLSDTAFAGMEYVGSRPETPREISLAEVDRCDLYVGIFAHRYGSGITEDEYRRARQCSLPCLIYFKDKDVPVLPAHFESDSAKAERLKALKEELEAKHTFSTFTSPEDLAAKVVTDLHRELVNLPGHRATSSAEDGIGHQIVGDIPLDFAALRRLCAQQVAARIEELGAKYDAEVYVPRSNAEQRFQEFLRQSDKNCLLFLGPSGIGKTNILCHLAQEYATSHPVVFLGGTMRIDRPNAILERVADTIRFGLGESLPLASTLKWLDEILNAQDAYLLVFIDGINETGSPAEFKEELRVALQNSPERRIRFCLSCRDQFWAYFDDEFWKRYVYFSLIRRPGPGIQRQRSGRTPQSEPHPKAPKGMCGILKLKE